MLPHEHHDELGTDEHTEEHAQADDLLDYLALVFHADLGDGHMESFDQQNEISFDITFTVDLFPDLPPPYTYYPLLLSTSTLQKRFNSFDHGIPILKKEVIAHLDFRGPPTFV